MAIRPEDIAIVENDDKGRNVFSGKVEGTKDKPYFTELIVNTSIPLVVMSQREHAYHPGDNIKIRTPPEKVVVIEKT